MEQDTSDTRRRQATPTQDGASPPSQGRGVADQAWRTDVSVVDDAYRTLILALLVERYGPQLVIKDRVGQRRGELR